MAEKKTAKSAGKRVRTSSAKTKSSGSDRAKKKTTSKTTTRKKSSPVKTKNQTSFKKPAQKKAAAKKSVSKTTKKPATRSAAANNTQNEPATGPIASPYRQEVGESGGFEDAVSVPRTASKRLVEKAAFLQFLNDGNIDSFIVRLARNAGVLSLICGLLFSSSALFANELIWPDQQAALTALTTDKQFMVESTTEGINTELVDTSAIDLVFDIESVLTGQHDLLIDSSHGNHIDAYLKSVETGMVHKFDLIESDTHDRKWFYQVYVGDLPAGTYKLKAHVTFERTSQIAELYGHTVEVRPVTDPVVTTTASTENGRETGTTSEEVELDTAEPESTTVLEPELAFVTVPDTIRDKKKIDILAVNIESISLILRDSDRTVAVRLPETARDTLTNTYTFTIDPSQFETGTYDLLIKAKYQGESISKESDRFELINTSNEPKEVTEETGEVETKTIEEESEVTTTVTKVEESGVDTKQIAEQVRIVRDDSRSTERYRVFKIEAKNARFVELHLKPYVGTQKTFLGLANTTDGSIFSYALDTKKLPNGRYLVYATAKLEQSLVTSTGVEIRVLNDTVKIPTATASQDEATTDSNEDSSIETVIKDVSKETEERTVIREVSEADGSSGNTSPGENYANEVLVEYRADIEAALKRYTSALRAGNAAEVQRIKTEIEALSERMLLQVLEKGVANDYLDEVERRLVETLRELTKQTETTEEIIKERTNDSISIDTDGDGITDYDERMLYGTDPDAVDTDQDGFSDGAEILSGFDPTNPAYEAVINYESPQRSGVVREDVLTVSSVQTVTPEESEETNPSAKAVFSGTALPNSFVTLFIFSTPIIVSVRTGDDGSWSYTFDKELEDGTHEVYVGMTDNTGRIVAKSNPFQFVKEAQAFTPVDAVAGSVASPAPEKPLSSPFTTPLVLGLTLLVIGLMLIMLGRYLDSMRKEDEAVNPQPA